MSRRPVEVRRAELIEVGKRVFSSRAYDAISTEDLAAAAGISKGLLYHYFESKHGFYLATLSEVARELLAALPLRAGPASTALDAAIRDFIAFARSNITLLHALLRGGVGADAGVHALVEGVRQELLQRLVALTGRDGAEDAVCLYGWLGMVEAATLHAFAPEAPPRLAPERLAALLRQAFPFPLENA